MRKVVGISETVFDILFKNDKPMDGVPGGSVLNCMLSLGRTGTPACLLSETGDDHVGRLIARFLTDNGVSADCVVFGAGKKSSVSLAFLDENNDAHYTFYKDYSSSQFQLKTPEVNPEDIVIIGSYFAVIPSLRPQVKGFLEYARSRGAIIYYDINFRPNHIAEKEMLMEPIRENMRLADIVRGSADDFELLFGHSCTDRLWNEEISPCCSSFICTRGAGGTDLRTESISEHYPSRSIQTVSTVGAGDSFNAGILYGIIRCGFKQAGIAGLSREEWSRLIEFGTDFSSDVCQRTENCISRELAAKYRTGVSSSS